MRTDGRTDGQTDMTHLIVAFKNFANALKIGAGIEKKKRREQSCAKA